MAKDEKEKMAFTEDKTKIWHRFNDMRVEYKGHMITFDLAERAFYAKIAGGTEYRQDLDELMKRIDNVVRRTAQVGDLQLLFIQHNFHRVIEVRITQILPTGGVKAVELEPRGGLRSRPERHDWSKFEAQRVLVYDTPRNRKIIEEIQELRRKRELLDGEIDGKKDELAGIDVDDYLAESKEAAA